MSSAWSMMNDAMKRIPQNNWVKIENVDDMWGRNEKCNPAGPHHTKTSRLTRVWFWYVVTDNVQPTVHIQNTNAPGRKTVQVHPSPITDYKIHLLRSFSLPFSPNLLFSFPFSLTQTQREMSPRKGDKKEEDSPSPLYHVIHKLPPGDSPYVRAKHVQVIFFSFLFLSYN